MMSQGSIEELRRVDDFVLSEIFYTACLETLLSAYIAPLSNTIGFSSACLNSFSSPCSEDFSALLYTFGVDILEVLSCHRALINALQVPELHGGSGSCSNAKGDNFSGENALGDQERNLCSGVIPLLRTGIPALRAAYRRYMSNFDGNVKLSELASSFVASDVWSKVYPRFARSTLLNFLRRMGVDKKSAVLFSECCNVSFEALISLPIQHITRYPISVKDLITAQQASGGNMNLTALQSAREVLNDLWEMCSAANAERSTLVQLRRLSELERSVGLTGVSSRIIAEGDVAMGLGKETPTGQVEKGRYYGRVVLLNDHILLLLPHGAGGRGRKKLLKKLPLRSLLSVRTISAPECSAVYLSYASGASWGSPRHKSRVCYIVLRVSNETEAILWVRDITQAVSDLDAQMPYL